MEVFLDSCTPEEFDIEVLGKDPDIVYRQKREKERQERERRLISKFDTWTTKEGQKIKISEMTNEHILNCIIHLNRKNPNSPYLQIFKSQLVLRLTN